MTGNFDTLFLDRDGVINIKKDNQYILDYSQIEFVEGSLLAISRLSMLFKRIIIITNQQGIGKGLMSEQELVVLHDQILDDIEEAGGKIAQVYYCPHLASADCQCRKPKSGMILKAFEEFPDIDVEYSYLIGDSESDIEAGERENLHTVKVNNQYTLSIWCNELLRQIK